MNLWFAMAHGVSGSETGRAASKNILWVVKMECQSATQ